MLGGYEEEIANISSKSEASVNNIETFKSEIDKLQKERENKEKIF
jgi:hypothetical protein